MAKNLKENAETTACEHIIVQLNVKKP